MLSKIVCVLLSYHKTFRTHQKNKKDFASTGSSFIFGRYETMIYKMCRKCKKIIKHPAIYCNECLEIVNKEQAENKKQNIRNYNKKRDPKYKTFYNSKEWSVLKEKKLQDTNYKCERCGELAEEVHHIEPIQTEKGWLRRLDYSNLESLCIECHNYRHKRFQKRKRLP